MGSDRQYVVESVDQSSRMANLVRRWSDRVLSELTIEAQIKRIDFYLILSQDNQISSNSLKSYCLGIGLDKRNKGRD